jgi:hypothetical protein
MASPNGDTSEDKAVPYVVNFQMVDTRKDGKITQDEFKAGCGKETSDEGSLPGATSTLASARR